MNDQLQNGGANLAVGKPARVAKSEQRIARARKDHAYKIAHRFVRSEKKVFFHEDLDLKNLTKRNKAKIDETGNFLPNGQSAKAGLNKSWQDAAFGQSFQILEYIAKPARSGGERGAYGVVSLLWQPPNPEGFPRPGDWRAKAQEEGHCC